MTYGSDSTLCIRKYVNSFVLDDYSMECPTSCVRHTLVNSCAVLPDEKIKCIDLKQIRFMNQSQ